MRDFSHLTGITIGGAALSPALRGFAVPPAAKPGNTSPESHNLEVIKPSTVNEAELEHNPSFETLRDYALAHNPSVSEALSAWRAASAQVVTASSWENPMISYSPDTGNMVETKNGMQTNGVGVSQAIPFPGKLTIRGEVANQQALAAHALPRLGAAHDAAGAVAGAAKGFREGFFGANQHVRVTPHIPGYQYWLAGLPVSFRHLRMMRRKGPGRALAVDAELPGCAVHGVGLQFGDVVGHVVN